MADRTLEQTRVPARNELQPGSCVAVVQKKDYITGALTYGRIAKILTNKNYHTRGIKVMLEGDENIVGRVQKKVSRLPDISSE